MDTTLTLPPELHMADQPIRTSIHTAPRSKLGKLLRLAGELMPTVTPGEKGWVQDTIENALTFYIEAKVSVLPHADPDTEAKWDR